MTEPFVYAPPADTGLAILYQDKDVLAVHKPSGLLTNPGRGEHLADCLLSRVQQRFPTALLVHRLDTATSGVVIFALRKKAESALKQQFATRQTGKIYLARVAGIAATDQGIIELPLSADLSAPPRNKVDALGKAAWTTYQVLERHCDSASTTLALWPKTGRAHQLRVHLQAIGHPILGDTLYGEPLHVAAAPRLLLHAYQLGFLQPYSQQPVLVTAPVDLGLFGLSHQPSLAFLAD
jgi:tRNA pseudouridine32 synthase/23S rRNA pseudouridine746 synthase